MVKISDNILLDDIKRLEYQIDKMADNNLKIKRQVVVNQQFGIELLSFNLHLQWVTRCRTLQIKRLQQGRRGHIRMTA